jgi:ATP-dependent Clp protease ATP-binding subunit ClpA
MRIEKLTTKFQEALGEGQSLALANDHAYITPAHVLVAMLRQDDGPKALLQRAGVNVAQLLTAAEAYMKKQPQVQGQEQVSVDRDMGVLLQAAEKESIKRGDQFVAGELFLLALADSKIAGGRHRPRQRHDTQKLGERHQRCARRPGRGQCGRRRTAGVAEKILYRPDRACPHGQA